MVRRAVDEPNIPSFTVRLKEAGSIIAGQDKCAPKSKSETPKATYVHKKLNVQKNIKIRKEKAQTSPGEATKKRATLRSLV